MIWNNCLLFYKIGIYPMQTINLTSFPCLGKEAQLQSLNNLVDISDSLMPHQIAVATGCSIDEALAVLLLLLRLSTVKGFLLVYHSGHEDNNPPIMARNIFDGLPILPFICEVCQKEIINANELSYDFLFKLIEKVHFGG